MPAAHRATRKQTGHPSPVGFNIEKLLSLTDALSSGLMKVDKITVSDDMVSGLRAICRNTGGISYHVAYVVNGSRPYLKIGSHPGMTIAEARAIAKTVIALSKKGIDPQDGLHARLIRELREQGEAWRP